jgi:hypothetical protein
MPEHAAKWLLALTLSLPGALEAWDPGSSWLQLERQHRADRQALDSMQQDPPLAQPSPPNAQAQAAEQLRELQQRSAQARLQESQRRRQLILDQRWRVMSRSPGDRAAFYLQQQRNLQEQRYQINRFRLLQQLH